MSFAFGTGKSKGTFSMIQEAKKLNKPLRIKYINKPSARICRHSVWTRQSPHRRSVISKRAFVKWNVSPCSTWNNSLRELVKFDASHQVKWNKSSPPQRFHTPQAYFTPAGAFHKSRKGFISLKKALANASAFFHGGHARTRTVGLLRVKQAW